MSHGMVGDRDPGYWRYTKSMKGQVSAQEPVQPAPYRAITMGPRHTFGPVLLQSADFGVAPILSADSRGAGNNDLSVMALRNSMLLTPRAPLLGFFDGDIRVGLPSLPATYDAAEVIVPPVIDLLFWKEKKDQYPYRGDDSFTFNLTNGQSASVPCFARRRVSVTFDCTADGTVEVYVGNASATNVHDITDGKIAVALTAGKRSTIEFHELMTAAGVSPYTPTGIVGVSRPDWLFFDIANNATFVITVYASDER